MSIEIPYVIYAAVVIMVAGLIRGYSGFGMSITIVVGTSLVFRVSEIVPVVLLLEVIASSYLIPKIFDKVDWPSLVPLLAGIAIGTPLGVHLLVSLSDVTMRIIVALVVLALLPLLWKGFRLKRMPGKAVTIITGTVSGLMNGAAAIGGPPVVMFYFSSPKGVEISRASLIAFFLVTDIIASVFCAYNGLLTTYTLTLTGIFVIPLIIGLALGSRSFLKTEPEVFRKRVLLILMIMAVVILIRSFI